jgi:hypothetical protein
MPVDLRPFAGNVCLTVDLTCANSRASAVRVCQFALLK